MLLGLLCPKQTVTGCLRGIGHFQKSPPLLYEKMLPQS